MSGEQSGDRITLSEQQRERIDEIKDQVQGPDPTDEHVLNALLDTWDAVENGSYYECMEPRVEHTHWCDDCDEPLAPLWDDREDEDTPLVCGHCDGTNTRRLDEPRTLMTDGGRDEDADKVDRLFVPLNSEPWHAFAEGEKEAEFRGLNAQFNQDTVYEGRRVELRRGYSTDDSLWGTIAEVAVDDHLGDLVEDCYDALRYDGKSIGEVAYSANELVGDCDEPQNAGVDRKVCLDLFAGLGGCRDEDDGFSAAFQDSDRWDVTTVDIQERFDPDICADVMDLRPQDLPDADVVLAAPPCTQMSMANQPNPHWDGDTPDSPEVREAITLTYHAIGLIRAIDPDYWFLENPRQGKMDVILGEPAGYVTYCQYGLDWQKPTNLWGEHPPMDYRTCSPGSDCHQRAEGGWDTGEKRKHVRDPAERSLVPRQLSDAILEAVEEAYRNPPPEQTTLMTDGGREQDDAAVPQLKFAEEHVDPILKGTKTVTLRPTLDESISIGDRLQLCDESGERFASVIVGDRGYTTIDMAARMDWDGHRSYRDAEDLLDVMNGYYPSLDLGPTSKVEIIRWNREDLWE